MHKVDLLRLQKEIYGEKDFRPLAKEQMNLIERISHNVHQIKIGVDELLDAKQKAQSIKDNQKQAEAFCQEVKPLFSKIREDTTSKPVGNLFFLSFLSQKKRLRI